MNNFLKSLVLVIFSLVEIAIAIIAALTTAIVGLVGSGVALVPVVLIILMFICGLMTLGLT